MSGLVSGPADTARRLMVERQLRARGVDARVAGAMEQVPRERFMADGDAERAYDDTAAPIGYGQTISQPYIVALICQYAKVRPGDTVLDVGTGSGYQAAVLAELGATVHSIECVPELARRAQRTLDALGYSERVTVHEGDGSLGLPALAPFQAIVAAAAAPKLPAAYLEQLIVGGRAVCPVGRLEIQRLVVAVRRPHRVSLFTSLPVRFVPMLGADGYTMREDDAP